MCACVSVTVFVYIYGQTLKRCPCLIESSPSAELYVLLSERLFSSTLGCCKSPHKVFIRLNLGTLLQLAFELVNLDQGRRKREAACLIASSRNGASLFIEIRESRVPPCGRLNPASERHINGFRIENPGSICEMYCCVSFIK